MTCISSANLVVLINGRPTSFFGISWGLRQGCALLPLLLILVIDGLSRGIKAA